MPLKLVIGPANAEKAGVVLDAYRTALAVGEEPVLVVPTFADVDYYRRELAASGAVFGVDVMRFEWLLREIAERAGIGGRPLGRLARDRVVATALARARLGPLEASARTPGFAKALLRLIDEFEEVRAGPARVTQALRAWGADDLGRSAYAEDLAALVGAYHRELERLRAVDDRLQAAAALDALRLAPGQWGETPVCVYGFDDLTPLQRDAIETLACVVGADVTVSLTYEPGREAFAARARTFEELRALPGAEVVPLEARTDHYAPGARAALHHVERSLFEPGAAQAPDAGAALLVLEAGGERAEVELVGAHVARLIRDEGYAPEEIAVVWRAPKTVAALVEQIFGAYGIPHAVDRRLPAGHTALGRGLLGLLRAAGEGGRVEDLLAYLRTPGVLEVPELADGLEVRARREGVRSAEGARRLWEEHHFPLGALDRVAKAEAAGPARLCQRLAQEASILITRPHRGEARVLDDDETVDARVAGELRRALRELASLAQTDAELVPAAPELARVLADLQVRVGPPPGPGRVAVTSPFAIRARRVRALFACGLQEGEWPAPGRPEALLGDDERAELARASGLVLRHHDDALATERFLFYAAASRPTDLLVLSRRTADDDGRPSVPSFFLADATDLFAGPVRTDRRVLGA
ncbi:MAG: hypothetical protein QOI73_2017, partial [Solirubrobacteraceae bacterium]|nr:hypothetical protein [Solirubrobacteraceae bacterium]